MGYIQEDMGCGLNAEDTTGIYIHIPFCKKKCPYCNFNSSALKIIPEKDYTHALIAELESVVKKSAASKTLETIYIGGGTPSIIAPKYIGNLLDAVKGHFMLKDNAEITIEINPAAANKDRFKRYKDYGINRISIGVQSFNNNILNKLGRIHNARDGLNACEYARDAGFRNISIDLIFGVPGQSMDMWLYDIETAVKLRPEHISIYGLTIEEGAEFYNLSQKGDLKLPDEEIYLSMYISATARLKEAGYSLYEISNMSLPDYESRHNLRYWQGLDYIGLGAGAHSYLSDIGWGKRVWNEEDISSYMNKVKRLGRGTSGMEALTKQQAVVEYLFLGLRQTKGINKKDFYNKFGLFPEDKYQAVISKLRQENLLENDKEVIRLTDKGAVLSDTVFADFV